MTKQKSYIAELGPMLVWLKAFFYLEGSSRNYMSHYLISNKVMAMARCVVS